MKCTYIKFESRVMSPVTGIERECFGKLPNGKLESAGVSIEVDGATVTLTSDSGNQTVVTGVGFYAVPDRMDALAELTALTESLGGYASELPDETTSVEKLKTVPPSGSFGQMHPRERAKPVQKTRRKGEPSE